MIMLPIPDFIQQTLPPESDLPFRWDEWNTEMADEPLDIGLMKQFETLSHRATLAFTIISAYWILNRFSSLVDETIPLQALEAAWAQQIHFLYSWDWDLDRDWTGPIRGPIRLALDKVTWAVQETRDYRHPAWGAASISKLVEYVLIDPTPYISWRAFTLSRLQSFYQFDPLEPLGDVVPPQAFDPSVAYTPESAEQEMNEFLKGLNLHLNPFLNSREQMLEIGFQGTPYHFNAEQDRIDRFEW